MQIEICLNINYRTKEPVPIPDIIASLEAAQYFVQESTDLIPELIPQLDIESVRIGLRELREGSLKEVVAATLIVTFQDEIKSGIPSILADHFDITVADNLEALVSVIVLVLIFQGTGFIKDLVLQMAADKSETQKLAGLLADVSQMTGLSVQSIQKKLEKRYVSTSSIKRLVSKSVSFLSPSKNQKNEPIEVGSNTLPTSFLRSVPAEFEIGQFMEESRSRQIQGLQLEIHQKDKDREQTGWAAIPVGVHKKRLPVRLMDGVSVDQLWIKDLVVADCIIVEKRVGFEFVPKEIHVLRVL